MEKKNQLFSKATFQFFYFVDVFNLMYCTKIIKTAMKMSKKLY